MLKKILIVLLILCCFSCSGTKEKKADLTDDNYRVFYEIFVGSFSDSNNDGVGDLNGIVNRLNYLNDGDVESTHALGIQGIWLTPIFESPSYHKYDVTDYYAIDDSFGTMDDLKYLIEKCHERNVLVILDLVINHTSSQHEWFRKFTEAHQKKDTSSPYYDYYVYIPKNENRSNRHFCDLLGTDEKYECNFSYDMPELNFDNEYVRSELLDIAQYYLALGVDGFRFDAAKYLYYGDNDSSIGFWKEYTDKLRKIKEDIYLVAEVWSGESEIDQYIAAMNCFNFAMSQSEGFIANAAKGGDINTYTNYVVKYQDSLSKISKDAMPISFISNHDMDRAAGYLNVFNGRAYIGANLLLLSPGSPFIYYGEEIGMKGTRGTSNTDANRRLAMLWGDGDMVRDPEGANFDASKQSNGTVADQTQDPNSILNYYSKLISFRNRYPQIARGHYEQLNLNRKDLGGFIIEYNNEKTYLIHNNSQETITVSSELFSQLIDSIGMNDAKLNGNELTVGPYTSVILH